MQYDRWGVLPNAGGSRDQEAGLLDRMGWASATNNAFRGYITAPKLGAWIGANPELHDLYKYVIGLLEADGLI